MRQWQWCEARTVRGQGGQCWVCYQNTFIQVHPGKLDAILRERLEMIIVISEQIVKLGSCSSLLISLLLAKSQFRNKRSRADALISVPQPPTHHPQLLKADGMTIFTLIQLTNQMRDIYMTFQRTSKWLSKWQIDSSNDFLNDFLNDKSEKSYV